MPDDVLTEAQALQLGALMPDDLEAVRALVRTHEHAWELYYRDGAGVAVVLAIVGGRLHGWCAYPATTQRSADVLGRFIRAGLDLGVQEVLAAAGDMAEAVIERNRPH